MFEIKMYKAASVLGNIFAELAPLIQPGITTMDIDYRVRQLIELAGAQSATIGYKPRGAAKPFPAACCTSINNIAAHGIPGPRQLLDGDIISIDISIFFDGAIADSCVTYLVGDVSEERRLLAAASRELNRRLVTLLGEYGAGIPTLSDIGAATQIIARSLGFHSVAGMGGHGIGTKLHQPPYIPSTPNGDMQQIPRNTFFTIEPVIASQECTWHVAADGWTILTDPKIDTAQTEFICHLDNLGNLHILFAP